MNHPRLPVFRQPRIAIAATGDELVAPGSVPDDTGYFVQDGPLPFGSDYTRSQGGTMLHWLGTCLRMVPSDFEMCSRSPNSRTCASAASMSVT